MASPLVARPPYGHGHPAMPVGESKLPSGGPSDKGLPLDSGIPQTKTYAKPVDDIREFDKADEGSIYKKDTPDEVSKPQQTLDGDRRQNDWLKPHYSDPGSRPSDDTMITKYPYRDGLPHAHSAAMVLGLWQLRTAHDLRLDLGFMGRVAATLAQVTQGLSDKVLNKAIQCKVTLKRVDVKHLRWIFTVDSGNGPKLVRLKAKRKSPNIVDFAKMDVYFSCSCPAWHWLGPEHNAQKGKYLDGKPVGTASPPDIKDPKRANKVCKHVAAVADFVRAWKVPSSRPKSP